MPAGDPEEKSRNAPGLNGMWQDFVDKYCAISRPSDVCIASTTLLDGCATCSRVGEQLRKEHERTQSFD
ncbi:uncharacterized protein FTJAE_5760 [Fusarium tjaetaba]|uniref:Uncharacterized protein n=1 Tax=Fusarium tjaetaba TaxID=1567544 RepID=A0A8H5RKT8_9HYPO|nr:uncharacterized protein FTJAE_5760 [Fusarium tjaetaba]KAF5637345.1 hypothetical protein FTJAE_5760 [Fusarium tjaetaba]